MYRRVLNAIGWMLGTAIASALDAALFVIVFSIPMAALVFLGIISHGAAMIGLQIVASCAIFAVILRSTIKLMGQ